MGGIGPLMESHRTTLIIEPYESIMNLDPGRDFSKLLKLESLMESNFLRLF